MSRLISRNYEPSGQLQMAEGRMTSHAAKGTDIDDVFLVSHYPRPAATDGSLEVIGRDGTSARITLDDLRTLPQRSVTAVLECAGNGRGLLATRSPGSQFGLGMFGQSTWRGATLRDVLELAGVSAEGATQVVVMGSDEGVTMPENSHDQFGKGIPLAKALHPDTILAWQVDDREVPHAHGGPLRLVVPGWFGIWWVKWPKLIQVRDEEFTGFWQNERYTYQDETGAVLSVVEELYPRAVLRSPLPGAEITDEAELELLAWAGELAVVAVQVSFDDGATWLDAEKVDDTGPWGWSRWTGRVPAGLPRGLRRIAVRARDAADRGQDWQPGYNRLGYANNGIQVIDVDLIAPAP